MVKWLAMQIKKKWRYLYRKWLKIQSQKGAVSSTNIEHALSGSCASCQHNSGQNRPGCPVESSALKATGAWAEDPNFGAGTTTASTEAILKVT